MKFRMVHSNFNVLDLVKCLKFYSDAFDMKEVRRINAKDGSFIIVCLEDGDSVHQLELTCSATERKPLKAEFITTALSTQSIKDVFYNGCKQVI